jgi:hypothetical protein
MFRGKLVLGILGIALVTLLVSSGVYAIKTSATKPDRPMNIHLFVNPGPKHVSVPELAKGADVILIGVVEEILPSKKFIPESFPDRLKEQGTFLIATDVVISVEKYLKNPLQQNEITVRTEGGKVGESTMTAQYQPQFESGEKVLLFLGKRPDGYYGLESRGKFTIYYQGEQVSPSKCDPKVVGSIDVTEFYQGKYRLTKDWAVSCGDRENTMPLEELLNQIETAVGAPSVNP